MRNRLILLLLLVPFTLSASPPRNALSLGGKMFFSIGENTEGYEPGYGVSLGYERRFGKYIGIELQPGFSYIYAEMVDNLPVFGAWIDNYMVGAMLIPRLYLPVSNDFRVFCGGGISYAYLMTDVSLYLLYYDGLAERVVEREWSESADDHLVSYLITGGAEVSIGRILGLSLEAVWNPLNVSAASDGSISGTEISMKKNSVDDDTVDINSIGIQLKAKLIF